MPKKDDIESEKTDKVFELNALDALIVDIWLGPKFNTASTDKVLGPKFNTASTDKVPKNATLSVIPDHMRTSSPYCQTETAHVRVESYTQKQFCFVQEVIIVMFGNIKHIRHVLHNNAYCAYV